MWLAVCNELIMFNASLCLYSAHLVFGCINTHEIFLLNKKPIKYKTSKEEIAILFYL